MHFVPPSGQRVHQLGLPSRRRAHDGKCATFDRRCWGLSCTPAEADRQVVGKSGLDRRLNRQTDDLGETGAGFIEETDIGHEIGTRPLRRLNLRRRDGAPLDVTPNNLRPRLRVHHDTLDGDGYAGRGVIGLCPGGPRI
ncbi:MAG: hypothetical protein R3C68_08875 [Myxococcota bacterium]